MRYRCFCKATNREDKEPRYSHNWVVAKRAFLKSLMTTLSVEVGTFLSQKLSPPTVIKQNRCS